MSYLVLRRDPAEIWIVDQDGDHRTVVESWQAGKVSVEFERNFLFLDGQYRPAHYVRLTRRPSGIDRCALISQVEAERISQRAGLPVVMLTTPIPMADEADEPVTEVA